MNNKLFSALSALLCLAACNTVEKDVEIPEKDDTGKVEVIITASTDTDTKTVLDDNYTTVLWKPSDEIKVFSAGEDSKFTSLNTTTSSIAQFRGMISVITGISEGVGYDNNIYGLYPYNDDATLSNGVITTTLPSTQTAVADSFDDDLFITIGKSETLSMGFYNVCSGLRFSFSESGYTSLTLTSNNGEALAGTFSVGFDNSGKPAIQSVSSPATSITVNAPSGGFVANTWYYVICLPGTYTGGITLSATNGSGTGTYEITSSLTFERSRFKQVAGLDTRLVFPEPLPDFIDLGLTVLWGTRNIGASLPEEAGNYYAWGEIDTKESYSWSNYTWCFGGPSVITKYCTLNGDGYVDGKHILDPEDDIVSITFGNECWMPTCNEYKELIDFCSWVWDSEKYGYIITSTVEGYTDKSIFLPAAGYRDNADILSVGDYGHYWTSECNTSGAAGALDLLFSNQTIYSPDNGSANRCRGFSVRGVKRTNEDRQVPVREIVFLKQAKFINCSSWDLLVNQAVDIVVDAYPTYATNRSTILTSSDETVVALENGGRRIRAKKGGLATITATAADGSSVSSSIEVTVHEPVDLGLSVKWSNYNLGQTFSSCGDLYAWGETSPKKTYSWSNYKHGTSWDHPTKYILDSDYGTVDNKSVLDPMDDAGYIKLGGYWRMPTWGEISELLDCTWTWTEQQSGNVCGYLVQGTNGASIFLPVKKYHSSEIWMSNNVTDYEFAPAGYAWMLSFSQNEISYGYDYRWAERYHGFCIHPVCN